VGIACRQIPGGGDVDFAEITGVDHGAQFGMPLIWRQSLAVALGVGGQGYLGILHPPASGLSLVFASSSEWSWGTMAAVMLVDVVVVVMSMVILNLSAKKQYPLWWFGLGWASTGGTVGRARRTVQLARRRASGMLRRG